MKTSRIKLHATSVGTTVRPVSWTGAATRGKTSMSETCRPLFAGWQLFSWVGRPQPFVSPKPIFVKRVERERPHLQERSCECDCWWRRQTWRWRWCTWEGKYDGPHLPRGAPWRCVSWLFNCFGRFRTREKNDNVAVIVDFTPGSGRACVAAARLGRRYVGFCHSALHADMICESVPRQNVQEYQSTD